MNRHFTSAGFLLCATLLSPEVSLAGVIFSNLGTSPVYDITQGNTIGNDFVGDILAEGDTFTPTVTSAFGGVELALSCTLTTCPDSYTVSLDQDSGADTPGTVIESFSGVGTSLGQLNVNNPLVVFNSVLKPTLTAGMQYWVTVATDSNNAIAWNLNTGGDMSDEALSPDGGATWAVLGNQPGAYQVDSVVTSGVPEPGAFWLLAGGLSWCLARRLTSRRV
jgi:hypothetical protein